MKRSVSYHHLAEIELNEAAEYYEGEHPGLGVAFLTEVERAMEVVLEFPEGSPRVGETVRSIKEGYVLCQLQRGVV